jgi:SAM-dependent methyltransferase
MIVEPKHFEYLVIQHGKVSDHRHDFTKWKAAYEASLADIFASILPALPVECRSVLDIGSGLGGIDILVAKHYSPQPAIYLLDGLDEEPVVKHSFKPFSNAAVAMDFQQKNGVKSIGCTDEVPQHKFDLVHSYFAYGFHIHPGDYLSDLRKSVHDKTILIFDVRRSKKEWLRELVNAFGQPKILQTAEKYVRIAFRA